MGRAGQIAEGLRLFAACAPGLEAVLLGEVRALGLDGAAIRGGVELRGSLETVARLNLWLRTASRVLVRLGQVRATAFPELVKKAQKLPFELCLKPGAPVSLRVACHKSRLYHSDAVAERLHRAISERLDAPFAQEGSADDEEPSGQLILARFERDVCTVSADSSGALLHKRGYRMAQSKAPLRETLAAALLLAAGYSGEEPFVDPMCGSGTIAIEAALIARRRAPGIKRAFAFQRWPGHDERRWKATLAEARARELPHAQAPIVASDVDAGAVAAARANAVRAEVESDLELTRCALADLAPPSGLGLAATNPPYGVRVGEASKLPGLYRELGRVARERLRGWRLAALVPEERLARAADLRWQRVLGVDNGGLRVKLLLASL